jgi:hypothetical protein
MFTLTAVPNPLYTEGSRISRMVQVTTCGCGSSSVRKSYIGVRDVDGVLVVCNECGSREEY